MDQSPRLDLPYIAPGQALKHITHNEALQRLDALVQPVVESKSLATPPMTPLPGEAWIVPSGATGAWSGHAGEIAAWHAGAWAFIDPAVGWQVFDRDSATLNIHDGADWVPVAATGAGLPLLGIRTSADPTNRLAVSAPATLLTHEGNGHQLKLNKAATGDTASLLFQSNWSGHAEMGLMGDNHWRIKVSPDGAAWTNALTLDAATADASFAGSVRPAADNTRTLGASGARWSAVWSATGTIQTSDARLKTDIAPSDLGLDFILALNPVRYRWREGGVENGIPRPGRRLHYCLVAQQVAEAANACGAADRALHVLSDPADPQSQQALRYDQLIAPLIAAVQQLAARLETVERG